MPMFNDIIRAAQLMDAINIAWVKKLSTMERSDRYLFDFTLSQDAANFCAFLDHFKIEYSLLTPFTVKIPDTFS